MPFTEMYLLKQTLTMYETETKRHPKTYFNLLPGSKTFITPYGSLKRTFPQLGGFQKTHTEFLLMNRHKVTVQDYIETVKLLQPDYAVSPIEEIDSDNGKKKLQRAVKHSIMLFDELLKKPELGIKWIAPVFIHDSEKMLDLVKPTDSPVIIYCGQTISFAGLYDSLKEISQTNQNRLKGLAQGDPLSVIVGTLAGIDFFETDYALDLASSNIALVLNSDWQKPQT